MGLSLTVALFATYDWRSDEPAHLTLVDRAEVARVRGRRGVVPAQVEEPAISRDAALEQGSGRVSRIGYHHHVADANPSPPAYRREPLAVAVGGRHRVAHDRESSQEQRNEPGHERTITERTG